MIEIFPDVIIMNLFALGATKISVGQLNAIRRKCEQTIPSVSVRLDRDTLTGTCQKRPDLFSYEDREISRGYLYDPEKLIRKKIKDLGISDEAKVKILDRLFPDLHEDLFKEGQVYFSSEYVDEYYTWAVPEEYRSLFLKIVKECYESSLIAPA